ncbi:sensor histidine kinase [Cellulomonas terrae]|uniref:histidine kinase n=1 Tax=Cellulomonas terrae TaxID=311234 RepID=A0A511JK08_9CELL|nr:histidine kinase [Cellulomonas terrae]GEL98347.1 two-component sensor histidine kinase [Cellulomonas terrae]
MVTTVLRTLWAEPRPVNPPARNLRDWVLVAVLAVWSVAEAVLRDDVIWRPIVLVAVLLALAPLLWRRTHPLGAVVASFGLLTVFDSVRIVAGEGAVLLMSVGGVLVLAYSLFRWGAGREAVLGFGLIAAWLAVSLVADPTSLVDAVGAYAFFLFAAALGAAIRYHAVTRMRDIDEAKARVREQLARELHDTVAHHVSGIAIQAQAGRAVAASNPGRAVEALATIEDAATRTLVEMRTMVGVLRASQDAELAPQPGVADLEQLASGSESRPRVQVMLSGELQDLSPAVGAAIYRLAQESITNARRHARHATRVTVAVVGDAEGVRLTVDDDGAPSPAGSSTEGFGLVGMKERTTLLGGAFEAGPAAGRGWRVRATLPRTGTAR